MENLYELSRNVLCNHTNILKHQYDYSNALWYKKQFIPNNPNSLMNSKEKQTSFVDFTTINKKSCIYTSTEPDQKLWEKNFYKSPVINTEFNTNTKMKSSVIHNYN